MTLGALGLTQLALVGGCQKSGPEPPANPDGPGPQANSGEPLSAGQKVFAKSCARCHSIGTAEGGKKRMGPDLSKVAANPEHTRTWLSEYIRDPKSHKPDSKMMPIRLNDDDLKAVVDYLETLK
jgi:cytochrome c oxidase subunit 2